MRQSEGEGEGERKVATQMGHKDQNTTSQICLVAVILIAFRSGCGRASSSDMRSREVENETK